MIASGRPAEDIVEAEGLAQIDDEAELAALVGSVIAGNAGPVSQYREGKTSAFGFLVGQVMKASGGKANPKRVNELLRRALGA
jgi:aspartyl-tRNA(Asn)/glutamyl-tRNA(Gln) amidotransferase subunit B